MFITTLLVIQLVDVGPKTNLLCLARAQIISSQKTDIGDQKRRLGLEPMKK